MMLLREFAHDMSVKRKVDRARRERERKPNHRQRVLLVWMTIGWGLALAGTIVGSGLTLVNSSPWFFLVAPGGLGLVVLWIAFIDWYEVKHVLGQKPYYFHEPSEEGLDSYDQKG